MSSRLGEAFALAVSAIEVRRRKQNLLVVPTAVSLTAILAVPGNPYFRKLSEYRRAIRDAEGPEEVARLMESLLQKAHAGDIPAAQAVLEAAVGKPPITPLVDGWARSQEDLRTEECAARGTDAPETEPFTPVCDGPLARSDEPASIEDPSPAPIARWFDGEGPVLGRPRPQTRANR